MFFSASPDLALVNAVITRVDAGLAQCDTIEAVCDARRAHWWAEETKEAFVESRLCAFASARNPLRRSRAASAHKQDPRRGDPVLENKGTAEKGTTAG